MGLSAICALLGALGSAPQQPAPSCAAVVTGARDAGGRLRLDRIGLGDGGTAAERRAPVAGDGEAITPGGIRIRARAAGVKLDFAGGGELLISPTARVHLRDGTQTLANFGGVQLLLADGAILRAWPESGRRDSLRRVEVELAGGTSVLWRGDREVVEAALADSFHGLTLCALGDGCVLYEPTPLGPLVLFERILCPAGARDAWPATRLIVAGDALRDSLVRLPLHAPRRAGDQPDFEALAQQLAALAPELFAAGTRERPPGALGQLLVPLAQDWRLAIEVHPAWIALGLTFAGHSVPVVEWTVGTRTEVHFVRPDGGSDGGPRWYLSGIELRDAAGLLPVRPKLPAIARGKRRIGELGGRPVREIGPGAGR
jgi:hypothetical protein